MSKKPHLSQTSNLLNFRSLYLVFILFLLVLSILNLIIYLEKKPTVVYGSETHKATKMEVWQNVLSIHPDYFEGWIELATIQINNGNYDEAFNSYLNAKRLDPNSTKVKNLSVYFVERELINY